MSGILKIADPEKCPPVILSYLPHALSEIRLLQMEPVVFIINPEVFVFWTAF